MWYNKTGAVKTPTSSSIAWVVPLNTMVTSLASTTTSITTTDGVIAINANATNIQISAIFSDASAVLYLKFNTVAWAANATSASYDAFLTYANPFLQLWANDTFVEIAYKLSVGTATLLQVQAKA